MAKQTSIITAAQLSIIGATLIFVNVMFAALNGAPLLISSYPVSSIEQIAPEVLSEQGKVVYVGMNALDVLANTPGGKIRYKPFWGRISFGILGQVQSPLMLLWITLAVINLFLAILLYLKPEKPEMLGYLIVIFSILSIFTGGGFIIGLIFGVIGGIMTLQWRMTPGETFFGKFVRAARLDSRLYDMVKENPGVTKEAVVLLVFVNILSGLGSGLYTYNSDKILNSVGKVPFRILLLGEVFFDISVLAVPLIYIGIAILKWLALSSIIYFVGARLVGRSSEFGNIARSVAFSYTPISLQVLLPLLFSNEPFLTLNWPMVLYFITNFWMIFALVIAVRQSLDLSTGRSIGVIMLAGAAYWLIIYKMMIPMLFPESEYPFPGIRFVLEPLPLLLALVSCSVIFSILLGVFKRR